MSTKRRVLVIDDDRDIRETLSQVLGLEGFVTAEASNGREGLEKASVFKPDLILLDVMMPVLNGAEFRERQLLDSALSRIPVILLSADAQIKQQAEKSGIEVFLSKPVEIDVLLKAITRVLGAPPSLTIV